MGAETQKWIRECTNAGGRESERLLLVLMIDALRWDYIERVPCFRQLASDCALARLREPFGFDVWTPLFYGAEALKGNRFMFVFSPEQSPFGFLRAVSPDFHWDPGSRRRILSTAAPRLTDYVKVYASTLDVPPPVLPFLNFGWQQTPWAQADGYRSLAQEVGAAGWRWAVLGWPFLNASSPGDQGICEEACKTLERKPRFLFVHLQQTDGAGHCFGPGSRELTQECSRAGSYVAQILHEAQRRYREIDLLLFGDHGMVSVVGSIDLWSRLCALPLRLGEDYVCFLDSTVARFWFLRQGVREVIVRLLEATPGGRILDTADCQRFGLDKAGRENGELYFLAAPGLVFAPNFFDMGGGVPRGMHGYDPDCGDNQSVILYYSSKPAKVRFSEEVMDMPEVYSLCRHLLFGTAAERLLGRVSSCAPPVPARLTYCREAGAVNRVNSDLARIVAALRQEFPDLKSVLLTGSFGRGEGATWRDRQGNWAPVNDYDLIIVAPAASNQRAVELGNRLAAELGIDGVDIGVWPQVEDHWVNGEVPLLVYDLRYGTQVLWGDVDALAPLAFYSAKEVPLREGLQLLFNRMAGLQLALMRGKRPADCRYGWNQVTKAAVAVCDWHLLQWGDYTARTIDKMPRFRSLGQAAGLPEADRKTVQSHLACKLAPQYGRQSQFKAEFERVAVLLQKTIVAAARSVTGDGYENTRDLCERFPYAAPVSGRSVDADNETCLARTAGIGRTVRVPEPGFSLRNALYAALTAMIPVGGGETACEGLADRIVELPSGMDARGLRSLLLSLWEHWCH